MSGFVDTTVIFEAITSKDFDEKNIDKDRFIYATNKMVCAWYRGQPVYAQRVEDLLDHVGMVQCAQMEIERASMIDSLPNRDEVLKMPCVNLNA